MRLICAAVSVLLISGCSSFRADHPDPVPKERLLGFQDTVDNGSTLVVRRDIGMLGGGCYVAVTIDRTVAARIGIGEVATFKVPAGERVVGIITDTADDTLCGKGSLHREILVQASAGQDEQVRIVSENKQGFAILQDKKP
ncbi:3-isopropylmalate dehydratase [Pseudomonas putida]